MALDRKYIGLEMGPFEATLEKGQMELFAKAFGERNSIYSDEEKARSEGFRSIVALPTYLIRLGSREDLTYGMFSKLGINVANLLHGEQEFKLAKTVCAGDTLVGTKVITDIYDKKGGALDFLVTETSYRDELGEFVGSDCCTFIIRNS